MGFYQFKKGHVPCGMVLELFLGNLTFFWRSIGLQELSFHVEWSFDCFFAEPHLFSGIPLDSIGFKKVKFHLEWNFTFLGGNLTPFFVGLYRLEKGQVPSGMEL